MNLHFMSFPNNLNCSLVQFYDGGLILFVFSFKLGRLACEQLCYCGTSVVAPNALPALFQLCHLYQVQHFIDAVGKGFSLTRLTYFLSFSF